MRRLAYSVLLLSGLAFFAACNDDMTYADQVDRERSAINKYIADSAVSVITEATFHSQGDSTDVRKNEFVLFESSGLYLQIVRRGTGQPIADGESASVLCRFTERNLMTDSIQLSNIISPYFYRFPETMTVTNNSGTFEGSFDSSRSWMYNYYGSASIPSGWLAVLPYVNLDRWRKEDSEIAKVRIIVPHDLGQTYALQGVYPCLYDITFQRNK